MSATTIVYPGDDPNHVYTIDEFKRNWPNEIGPMRPYQLLALEKACLALNMGAKQILLQAPTGAGKSAIAICIVRTIGRSYITTMTKNLQDQYKSDFPFLETMKGKGNFLCKVKEAFKMVDNDKCVECGNYYTFDSCRHKNADYGPCLTDENFKLPTRGGGGKGKGKNSSSSSSRNKIIDVINRNGVTIRLEGAKCRFYVTPTDFDVTNPGQFSEKVVFNDDMLQYRKDKLQKWSFIQDNFPADSDKDKVLDGYGEGCGYLAQKSKVILATHSIFNYDALLSGLFSRNTYITPRHTMVFDETHEFEMKTLDYMSISISKKTCHRLIGNEAVVDRKIDKEIHGGGGSGGSGNRATISFIANNNNNNGINANDYSLRKWISFMCWYENQLYQMLGGDKEEQYEKFIRPHRIEWPSLSSTSGTSGSSGSLPTSGTSGTGTSTPTSTGTYNNNNNSGGGGGDDSTATAAAADTVHGKDADDDNYYYDSDLDDYVGESGHDDDSGSSSSSGDSSIGDDGYNFESSIFTPTKIDFDFKRRKLTDQLKVSINNAAEKMSQTLDDILIHNPGNWLVSEVKYSDFSKSVITGVEIKPLDPSKYTERIFKLGKVCNLFMSATILDAAEFCKSVGLGKPVMFEDIEEAHNLGLGKKKYEFPLPPDPPPIIDPSSVATTATADIQRLKQQYEAKANLNKLVYITIPSDFPVENRPVYFRNTAGLNFKSMQDPHTLKKLADEIERIIWSEEFANEKGLILTTSYVQIHDLMVYFSTMTKKRLIITSRSSDNNEQEKREFLKEHAVTYKDRPTILISPSLYNGVDLKDDLGRFLILLKIPYLPTEDRLIKAKMQKNERWYNYQALVKCLQGLGRIVRSRDDFARMFILDSKAGWFFSNNRKYIPDYVWKAFKTGAAWNS